TAPDSSAQKLKDKALPELNNGIYTIKVQNLVLEIDPAIGGRITSLNHDGINFFTDSSVNSFNWGSTFWPSPQSEWNWPPSSEIDNKPYSHKIQDNTLVMVSQKDPKTGFVITKTFSGSKRKGSFILKYTITNQSDRSQKVAPWEVSRVHIN